MSTESRSAANVLRYRVYVEVELDVDVPESEPWEGALVQAAQDALGHTGAKVLGLLDWRPKT